MSTRVVIGGLAAVLVSALQACVGDTSTAASNAVYVADLSGAREVPAVATTATGTATFTRRGTNVTYAVTASGFNTALTVGHVHIGAAGVIGSVIVPFTIVAQSGAVATGSIDLAAQITQGNITISGDSLKTLFETGKAYVNLHSAAYPGGEIRGQLVKR